MRQSRHRRCDGRKLTLIKKDATHFDFVFEPMRPTCGETVFKSVDVSNAVASGMD